MQMQNQFWEINDDDDDDDPMVQQIFVPDKVANE